jgi:hypothetical protein
MAVKNIMARIMIIHAQNDYSTTSSYALDSVIKNCQFIDCFLGGHSLTASGYLYAKIKNYQF